MSLLFPHSLELNLRNRRRQCQGGCHGYVHTWLMYGRGNCWLSLSGIRTVIALLGWSKLLPAYQLESSHLRFIHELHHQNAHNCSRRESRHAAIAEFHTKYFPARLSFAYAGERADRIEDAIEAYRGGIGAQPRMFFVCNICMIKYGGMTQRFASLKLPSRSSRKTLWR